MIFGDSLTYQAEPYFNLLVQADGRATVQRLRIRWNRHVRLVTQNACGSKL